MPAERFPRRSTDWLTAMASRHAADRRSTAAKIPFTKIFFLSSRSKGAISNAPASPGRSFQPHPAPEWAGMGPAPTHHQTANGRLETSHTTTVGAAPRGRPNMPVASRAAHEPIGQARRPAPTHHKTANGRVETPHAATRRCKKYFTWRIFYVSYTLHRVWQGVHHDPSFSAQPTHC